MDDDYLFETDSTTDVELTEDDVKLAIHKALQGLKNKEKESFVLEFARRLDVEIPYKELINIIEDVSYEIR